MRAPVFISLSLLYNGACLGRTIIDASANVVVIGMAEKRGAHISFSGFFKVAFPLMLLSIVISMMYLTAWYVLLTWALLGTLTLGIALASE